jgi:uncharacterized protein YutD
MRYLKNGNSSKRKAERKGRFDAFFEYLLGRCSAGCSLILCMREKEKQKLEERKEGKMRK